MHRKPSAFFKNSLFFGFIIAISLCSSTGIGEEGLNRVFVAGMPKNFPPHFFVDESSGKPTGFGVDVMNAVAKRCGITIEYAVFENWKETTQAAKDGRIDLIPNHGVTSERKAYVDFTSPYETFRIKYYIRATSSSLRSLADIGDRKIGVVVTNKARFILEQKGRYNLVKADSFEDLIWKLIAGDVDCIAIPAPVMDYLMQKSGLTDHIRTLGDPLVEIKRGISVTKGRKELFELLQSAMDDFILSQEFKDIYTKWYGQPEPYWTPKRIGIVSAILFCTTFLGMALWRYRFITRINKELERTLRDRTKKIQANEKRYKQMFVDNQAIKLVIDPEDGRIVEVNEAACRFYQYPKETFLSMKIGDINTLAPEKIQEKMDAAIAKHQGQFYFTHKLATGEMKDVEVYSGPINVGDKTLLFSIIHDISERRKAEAAIQKSEQKYRNLIQTASDGIYMISKNGQFSDVNAAACKMLNRSREEILNLDISGIDPNFSVEGFFDFWKKTPLNESRVFETSHLHKDGSLVPVEVSGQKFQVGEEVLFVGVARNIADRKKAEAERETLQKKLMQSQKMESIGNLAGGIAHDFNNILSSILGFSDLALNQVDKGSDLEDDLKEIHAAGMRARDLVRQILTFARKSEDIIRPVSVQSIAKEALKLIRSSIPATIQIIEKIDSRKQVLGNPTQIHQIFMNLFTNAAYVMDEKGGKLKVDLADIHLESAIMQGGEYIEAGSYIKIVVADTGIGIPDDKIKYIFEPYFTTKEQGEGTGLGLAVVHGIVEKYGGKILVESKLGEGTEFTVYLPNIENLNEDEAASELELPKGSERILFIDDEPQIVKIGSTVLSGLGYTVDTCTGSMEALELFRKSPDAYDIIISDMTMPNMTGYQLAEQFLEIKPETKFILCTGYSKTLNEDRIKMLGIKALLIKPVNSAEMATAVRNILDE